MKRKYIAPEMKVFNIPSGRTALLAGSETDLTPHDWTGGGDAT